MALSIARALQSFYAQIRESIDPRLAPELGTGRRRTLQRDRPQGGPRNRSACRGGRSLSEKRVPSLRRHGGRTPVHPEILVLGATGFIGQELARQLLAVGTVYAFWYATQAVCL